MEYQKGRGAQGNPHNRFFAQSYFKQTQEGFKPDDWGQDDEPAKTQYLEVFPKTIVNKVTSPDVGMGWSLNPYQGCEHGCIYCYARNSHEYWGYSAGSDFEQKILVKKNAPELLDAKLKGRSWAGETIVFSGNTDCYQPIERKLKITRALLQVMLKHRNSVGIITKNSLILRDLDILEELGRYRLVAVNVSITSFDEKLRRVLEPRTASARQRLKVVKELSHKGIPVNVMLAPVIPGLNSDEIPKILKSAAEHGAASAHYTTVRLNGQIADIFKDWISKTYPDRAGKVLNQIASLHGGQLNDSQYGRRQRGEGVLAKSIAQLFKLHKQRYFGSRSFPPLDVELYAKHRNPQLRLF